MLFEKGRSDAGTYRTRVHPRAQPGVASEEGGGAPAPLPRHPRARWLHAGATIGLFAVIWAAYYPSLGHTARSDDWCVRVDTIDSFGFWETFARTYSYNRTRVSFPGDYQLYRPVLFALLSAEKTFFGNHFAAWQLLGIGLHCVAVFLFLELLLQFHQVTDPKATDDSGPRVWLTERRLLLGLAYGLALFFGLNYAVVEMVIWSHINGYLLFVVLALGALLLCSKVLADPEALPGRQNLCLVGAFLLSLVSAFTYEIGQYFAVMAGGVLGVSAWRIGRHFRALAVFALFASILPLYQGINLLDWKSHRTAWDGNATTISELDRKAHPGAYDGSTTTLWERACSTQTLKHAIRYVLYTTVQPFFPSFANLRIYASERVDIQEVAAVLTRLQLPRWHKSLVASVVVISSLLLLTLRSTPYFFRTRGRTGRFLIVLLPFSLFVLHAAITVLGRMNLRPSLLVLSINSYYTYLPLLAVLVILYALWVFATRDSPSGRSVWVVSVQATLLLGLLAVSIASGLRVHRINRSIESILRPRRVMVETVQQLVDGRQNEPGFCFAFDESAYKAQETFHGLPLGLILFKRYINNHDPLYLFTVRDGRLTAVRRPDRGWSGRPQFYPDLVEVGSFYNFFSFEGWYYGVLFWDGHYNGDPGDAKKHVYLIKDRTIEGARGQIPGRLNKLREDLTLGRLTIPNLELAPIKRK